MAQREICSYKVTRGSRTYFFDINKSERGNLYLKISESKKTADGFEHRRIMVFDEDVSIFSKTLQKSLEHFKSLQSNLGKTGSNSGNKTATTRPKTYDRWTQAEDDKLEVLFCEGKDTKEISVMLERNISAINSRIKKLELVEKYGS